jgi:hypothetical protein
MKLALSYVYIGNAGWKINFRRCYLSTLSAFELLFRPSALENFYGGAGHIDAVIFFGPVQIKVAAGKMGSAYTLASVGHNSRYTGSTSPAATGQGNSTASLPR